MLHWYSSLNFLLTSCYNINDLILNLHLEIYKIGRGVPGIQYSPVLTNISNQKWCIHSNLPSLDLGTVYMIGWCGDSVPDLVCWEEDVMLCRGTWHGTGLVMTPLLQETIVLLRPPSDSDTICTNQWWEV